MKRTYLLSAAVALVAFGMTACGGSTEETTEEGPVTYTLDAEATTLGWKGDHTDGHGHTGTIKISEGTVVYNGDEFESGDFSVDMSTISDNDLPSPDKDTLNSHLSGPYFFNTAKFPATKVTIKSVSDKDIKASINVLGKDMDVTIPVKMKKTADKLTAKGTFTIDFTDLKMGGTQPGMNPADPTAHTNSTVTFDLNLVLNAEEAPAAE